MADVDICNRALYKLGHTVKVTTLDGTDTTAAALLCVDLYAATRDRLLESFEWRFAKRVAVLAEIAPTTTTQWRPDFRYAYTLPTDCLAPRSLWDGARAVLPDDRSPFEIQLLVAEGSTLALFCDVAPVTTGDAVTQQAPQLLYTSQVTDTALMPEYFQNALAAKLAAELAMPLTSSAQLANRAEQMAAFALMEAQAIDGSTQRPDPAPDNEFVSARG